MNGILRAEKQISYLIGEDISKLSFLVENLNDFENAVLLKIMFHVKGEVFRCKIPIKQALYDDDGFDMWNILVLPAIKEGYETRRNDKA